MCCGVWGDSIVVSMSWTYDMDVVEISWRKGGRG